MVSRPVVNSCWTHAANVSGDWRLICWYSNNISPSKSLNLQSMTNIQQSHRYGFCSTARNSRSMTYLSHRGLVLLTTENTNVKIKNYTVRQDMVSLYSGEYHCLMLLDSKHYSLADSTVNLYSEVNYKRFHQTSNAVHHIVQLNGVDQGSSTLAVSMWHYRSRNDTTGIAVQ